MVSGIKASSGIVLGKALLLKNDEIKIEKKTIVDVEKEKERFLAAVKKSKDELYDVRDEALKKFGEDKAKIFESYIMIMQDPEFIDAAARKIVDEKVNAEFAFKEVRDSFIDMFSSLDDPYMKERASDVRDVSNRILRNLEGIKNVDLSLLNEKVILVCRELSPSDTASMNKENVIGFLTDVGGRTSHTAIMARTLEIPTVVGMKDITLKVKSGDYLIVDGFSGNVFINPDECEIKKYSNLKEKYEEEKRELKSNIGVETKTVDGKHIDLVANIGTPNDVEGLIKNDAEGVGLYRTEFLYMKSEEWPDEEKQFQAYKTVLEKLSPKPVVIRTLDIGGDKKLPYLKIEDEMNPFLGYRAIRLCLDRTDIFKVQLRALLRASVYGNLRIMFPMISSVNELLSAKRLLEESKNELRKENKAFSDKIGVGMMIEVPSAAVISDILAKYVDFFSIGTNDLIQYTCAVDRMNEKIYKLYSQYNPAVLRLISLVIKNAHKEGKWVGMCGESAGDPLMIPLLLGMGLDEFSMSSSSVLQARRIINSLSLIDAEKVAEKALSFETDTDVERFLKSIK